MRRWIGFCGRAGAGKDFTFRELSALDENYVRVSFADELRHEIQDSLGRELPVLWNKPYSDEVRRLLQWWGTEYRREMDPDYWVKRTKLRAVAWQVEGYTPAFTDVRFPNEARMIEDSGGFIVRVFATESTREKRLGTLPPEHASETAMDSYESRLQVYSIESNSSFQKEVMDVLALSHLDDVMEALRASFQ